MARIAGVKSIHIAKIESYGENGKPVYGEVKELKQFISFSSTKNFSEMNWYSNDIVEETFKTVVDVELEIVLGKLDNETKGLIMGSQYTEKGVLVEKNEINCFNSLTSPYTGFPFSPYDSILAI